MQSDKEYLCYGCVFCKTGAEDDLAEKLKRKFSEIQLVVPKKKRVRRQGDRADELVVLFPGYLFFRADEAFPAYSLARNDDVYRLLLTDRSDWRLAGSDRALAESFFEAGGVIDLSKAYYEGNRIRIVDGFLKDYEGQIIRVNKRNRTAQIQLNISGSAKTLWLGFELISADGTKP